MRTSASHGRKEPVSTGSQAIAAPIENHVAHNPPNPIPSVAIVIQDESDATYACRFQHHLRTEESLNSSLQVQYKANRQEDQGWMNHQIRLQQLVQTRSFQSEWVLCEWINVIEINSKSRVNPCMSRNQLMRSVNSDARGRPNHHATNPIQAAHISNGPSRAAHVAANRYLSGGGLHLHSLQREGWMYR